MEQAPLFSIDRRYKTVRDLLIASRKPNHKIGSGDNATVYSFPEGVGLDDFVFRAKHELTKAELLASTSLSTFPELLVGFNAGQPLLYSGKDHTLYDMGVLLRYKGQSIVKATYAKRAEERCKNMYDLLQTVAQKSGKNPFVGLLRQAISLQKAGYDVDFKIDNIMVADDMGSLGLVDQLHGQDSNREQTIYYMGNLTPLEKWLSHILAGYLSTSGIAPNVHEYDKIQGMLLQAGRELLHEHRKNREDFVQTATFASAEKLCFGNVHTTQAISLDDPPSKLLEQLHRLANITGVISR